MLPHALRAGLTLIVPYWSFTVGMAFAMQAPGLAVFRQIAIVNAVFASFAVPLLFANAITEEKEERTLALLKVADVSGLTIVSGKAIPRLISVLMILLVQIPFSMLAITLGGVTLTQILSSYLAIMAYVVALGCLSLLCSVMFRKTANAVGMAGLLVLLYHTLPGVLFLTFTLLSNHPTLGSISKLGVSLLNYHWLTNVFIQLPNILSTASTEAMISWQVIASLLAGAVFFLLAAGTFEYFNREVDAAPTRRARRRRQPARSATGRPWKFALTWKDFKLNVGGIPAQVTKLIGYGSLFLLINGMIASWSWVQLDLVYAVSVFLVILLLILIVELSIAISRTFHREVREKTISSLILLPTPLWQIAYAKIFGSLISLAPVVLWMLIACCLIPDRVAQVSAEIFKISPSVAMNVLYSVTHFFLFLHLVAFLSLSIDSWWSLLVAALVQYFGISIPMAVVQMGLLLSGNFPTRELQTVMTLLSTAVIWCVMAAMHYLIGDSLKKKAAEN